MKERLKTLHKNNIKPEAPFYSVLKEYKYSAKRRKLKFALSEEQFKALTKSNCFYCNEPPATIKDGNGNYKFKSEPYIYNGIDRLNNVDGYTLVNCVSCCRECNWIKGMLSKEKFLERIKKIYEFKLK